MKITQLRFRNFRCFGPDIVEVTWTIYQPIGANGAGRLPCSGSLKTLWNAFQLNAFERGDFHVPPGADMEAIDQLELWIEAKLEFQLCWPTQTHPSVPECFRHMVVADRGNPILSRAA